jgi:hypothetical protein
MRHQVVTPSTVAERSDEMQSPAVFSVAGQHPKGGRLVALIVHGDVEAVPAGAQRERTLADASPISPRLRRAAEAARVPHSVAGQLRHDRQHVRHDLGDCAPSLKDFPRVSPGVPDGGRLAGQI